MSFPFNLIKVNTSIYAEEKKRNPNTLFEHKLGQKTVFSHDIL